MSDIRLYNYKKKKQYNKIRAHKEEIRNIIEDNIFELLGMTIISRDINLTKVNGELIDTLAYDEDMRLVVLEYHVGKFGPTISKGLEFLDYIRENIGKIKVYLSEVIPNKSKEIIYDPRLVCIGEDYNSYDGKAISHFPYDIDLIKFNLLDKEWIILEKIYHNYLSKDIDFKEFNNLYMAIDEMVYSLGDEISKTYIGSCISYRRIKNFMYVYLNDGLNVAIKTNGDFKNYKIKKLNDIDKIAPLIEECYDGN